MKNIIEICKDFGIEIPADKHAEFNKAVAENYKTVAEHEKKVNRLTDDLNAAKEALKGFEGIDPKDLQQKLEAANRKMQEMEDNHRKEAEEREFNSILENAITDAKGKNAKAIMALLDMDKLRSSRNQEKDIKIALDSLRTDSGYLFDDNGGAPAFTAPGGKGGNDGTTTVKDIMAIKDPVERQAKIVQNMHLFKKG